MLYTHKKTNFKHHVHPSLQRRIRLFLIIGALSLALVAYDVYNGTLSLGIAALAVVIGAVVGVITSRIFNLSWSHDGEQVVGRIDIIGWIVLVAYILFEVARSIFFTSVIHTGSDPTAITYAFVASALVSRVLGLRGRIICVLRQEKVLG
jgi:hypothetical protein